MLGKILGDLAGKLTGLASEYIVDKDKAIEFQMKLNKIIFDSVDSARDHDKASYGDTPEGRVVDFFRGMIRPVITAGAAWYFVYAKMNSIALTDYDYAIIAGVFTFWFGGKFLGKDIQK